METNEQTRPNRAYLIAAIATGVAAAVHGIAGEASNMRQLRTSDVPDNSQVEIHATWHGFTFIMAVSAALLLRIAYQRKPSQELVNGLIGLYAGTGAIFGLLALRNGPVGLLKTPQWALLSGISALIAAGKRSHLHRDDRE